MKVFLCFMYFFYLVSCKEERISDLYAMLNNPDILQEIEKRINDLEDDDDLFSDSEVKCYDNSGLLASDCGFHANSSTIIKTTESLQRGAKFLDDFVNVSCPKECTSLCCEDPDCDTAVYQDKGERKCYLFKCGDSSRCVFSHHSDYFLSSISKATHNSHSYTPGGVPYSHENDLENLGSHDKQKDTTTAKIPSTTLATTVPPKVKFPEIGEFCPSYFSRCEDPHAECMRQKCQCRVGYHQKHGIKLCRKHCSSTEFECEKVYDADSQQCVSRRHVCDGHPDCTDGSDEENCPDENKPAYLDGDGNNNFYNNPFYNSQYSQSDSQFPYGFPIPGLANQQQAGLYPPANQIYPGQGSANQNSGGQHIVPGLPNPNIGGMNVVPGGNQLNQRWPVGSGSGPQTYQNNVAYQRGPQQNYPPMQPGLSQKTVQPVQPVNSNIQQAKQNIAPTIQQAQPNQVPGNFGQQNTVPIQRVPTSAPVVKPFVQETANAVNVKGGQNQHNGYMIDHEYDSVTEAVETDRNRDRYPFGTKSQSNQHINSYSEETPKERGETASKIGGLNYAYHEGSMENENDVDDYKDKESHRHSAEEDDTSYSRGRTYPSGPKTKTQIVSPTQSTVAGQKTAQSHSEGFPDYSWLKYDDDSPRVSGKKGKTHNPSRTHETDTNIARKQPYKVSVKTDSDKSAKVEDSKQETGDALGTKVKSESKLDKDKYGNGKYNVDNRYPDEYRFQYDDYRRPGSNRRPPSYDRNQNRYDNSRRRPSPGTRYPYYDNGYQRGWDRDRERYPVWDPFKDEYYYPDVYDDRHLGHGLEYDGSAEEKPTQSRPLDSGSKKGNLPPHHFDKPKVTQPPTTTQKITEKLEVVVTTTTPKPRTPEPVNDNQQAPGDADQSDKSNSDSQTSADTDETDEREPVSSEQESGDQSKEASLETISNVTEDKTDKSNNGVLEILNADAVQVESFTDSSQGPIVALALGLAITMILLIFVGCRLRTVKRRLRKGRALHSNEADYLINGMYL